MASAVHKSFVCHADVLLKTARIDFLPHCNNSAITPG
jgi:hypothetical protein